MANVRQKPVAMLAFKRGGRGIVPQLPPPPPAAPPPPEGVGEYTLLVWESFWTTDVSGLVNMRRDGERLRYWLRCVDQRHRLWEMWAKAPLLKGPSGGAVRTNPLFRQIMVLSNEIERAEQMFGMTPLYKMRLTGALDQAEAAESNIKARREGRRPTALPARRPV